MNGNPLTEEVRDEALATRVAKLDQAQALIQKYAMGNNTSPVDELIAERRAEAAAE